MIAPSSAASYHVMYTPLGENSFRISSTGTRVLRVREFVGRHCAAIFLMEL